MRRQQEREREKEAQTRALAQGVIDERERAAERRASVAAKRAQGSKPANTTAAREDETAPRAAQTHTQRSKSPPIPTVAKRQPRPPAQRQAAEDAHAHSLAAELADQPVPRKPPGVPVARVQRTRASRLHRDKGDAAPKEPQGGRRQWAPKPDSHVQLPEVRGSHATATQELEVHGAAHRERAASPPVPTHRERAASPPVPTHRERAASPPVPTHTERAAPQARAAAGERGGEGKSGALAQGGAMVALSALSKLKQQLRARKAELAREVTQGEELLQHSGQIFAVNEMSRQAASDTLRRDD